MNSYMRKQIELGSQRLQVLSSTNVTWQIIGRCRNEGVGTDLRIGATWAQGVAQSSVVKATPSRGRTGFIFFTNFWEELVHGHTCIQ